MSYPDRRILLTGGSLALLALLAGCGSLPSAGATSTGASSSASDILAGIRRANGLGAVTPDANLEQAARQQAGYMASAGRMNHTTGWGKDFASRVKDNGIEGAAAENIAEGRMDVPRVFDMWMHSAPHRRNMLDPRFGHFGLAFASSGRNSQWRYWALVLGR